MSSRAGDHAYPGVTSPSVRGRVGRSWWLRPVAAGILAFLLLLLVLLALDRWGGVRVDATEVVAAAVVGLLIGAMVS